MRNPLDPILFGAGLRPAASPSLLTAYPATSVTHTVTPQTYGISVVSSDGLLLLKNTGYTDARIHARYYLTGFDGLGLLQFGVALRGVVTSGNFSSGYLCALRYTPTSEGGLNYGQVRKFGATGSASSVVGGDTTPPGDVQTYETAIVNIVAEIVGSNGQYKIWKDGETEPGWQASFTDSTHTTGGFGVGFNRCYSTPTTHVLSVLVRQISALSA